MNERCTLTEAVQDQMQRNHVCKNVWQGQLCIFSSFRNSVPFEFRNLMREKNLLLPASQLTCSLFVSWAPNQYYSEDLWYFVYILQRMYYYKIIMVYNQFMLHASVHCSCLLLHLFKQIWLDWLKLQVTPLLCLTTVLSKH